ncbi:MAG: DNA mismatch repair protein MutL [Ignavibacteria bacterium]|nr:DNA mismatch repair protein MutL [Ignavibacteria bacterium]
MGSCIKILPLSLSNKIAAGEVVNRPESVVKELMENSIDAKADSITVIIKDAGKSLIQVSDNGSGMSEDDAVLCFQRHSTSKITSAEDLDRIKTLGFRGEALASVASISHVELKTKTGDDEVGTLVRIEGGEVKTAEKTNCEKGTSIAVKNLFYNTPGRRNFLKSNQTEFRHIYETFVRIAVSNPGIEFNLFVNDDPVFELKKSDLFQRIKDIFSDTFSDSLIEVNQGNEIIKINGYISKPNFTKKSKQDQFFYLNGRFFINRTLNFAVYSGYDDLIEKGDYPSFFLFIEINPSKTDVNVHPSKMEVKFEDESAVFGMLRSSVREALKKSDIVFNVGFDNTIKFNDTTESFHFTQPGKKEFSGHGIGTSFSGNRQSKSGNIHSIFEASKEFQEDKKDEPIVPDPAEPNIFSHTKKSETEGFNVWQYQYKYIMCQTETGLMIIDQHAAHERILYEKALMSLNSQSYFSQQLLLPIKVNLTKIDYVIAQSLKDEFRNLGFIVNYLKDNIVELSGLPSDVKPGKENKIFQELIDQYKEYELKLNLDKRDNLAKSFACRSAIKSGDKLQYQEMVGLIDNLFSSQMPFVCPHGRPTVIRITTDELDKRFSRS